MQSDVEAVVSAWTGIPAEQLSQDDKDRLMGLDQALKGKVIGQDEAVGSVARAMRRARSGLKDPNRPIAAMLFSGPTGVGKTELTKVLCREYFGQEDCMIRLDMSEYMERHTVSKLIGAPPGYVGFGEGGKLTELVRRKPFTVLLLDEIEKAHPDVFNVLLQVLEDGRLTDSQGRTVSFKNTLIIMTSNVGSSVIAKGGAQLGFSLPSDQGADEDAYAKLKSLVTEELKGYFRPELLNRLDEVVVFRQLLKPDVARIAQLVLQQTANRLAQRDIRLDISPALMDRILEEGYDKEYGARPLNRAVSRLVDDPLSEALLQGHLVAGDTAYLDCTAGGPVTVSNTPPVKQPPAPAPMLASSIVDASNLLNKKAVNVAA
jgi:ATP-dependent Clp protease ATP-binding subunit ClpC